MKKIPLTQGKFALVDDKDFEYLNQWKWHYGGDDYAIRNSEYVSGEKRTTVIMHREILNAPKGIKVDHRDTDRLNNQRYNLRLATNLGNSQNRNGNKNTSSFYKGVTWMPRLKKWQAQLGMERAGIRINIYLGVFLSEHDAATAYNMAALRYHREYAKLNLIQVKAA